MEGRRLQPAAGRGAEGAEGRRLQPVAGRTAGTLLYRVLGLAAMVALYLLVAVAIVYLAKLSGNFKDGGDTMFYVHRGELLYRSITREGNWYPILDMSWYNGVQTWRYWSPLPAYILAGCQALAGGDSDMGFLLFIAFLYLACALVWMVIGCTHGRPWMGAVLGLIWFLVPNNVFTFFGEGVLARSVSLPALPIFFVALYDYLHRRRWSALPAMILSLLFIILCHVSWAVMVSISALIYLFFSLFTVGKKDRAGILPAVVAILLAFLISGIVLIPAMIDDVTMVTSPVAMASAFQSLIKSISPLLSFSQGTWNRFAFQELPYFGMAALLLGLLGILCAQKESRGGFWTALVILLLTTPTAFGILVHMPAPQYLWMTRFLSIALCILLVSFFFWLSLRRGLQTAFLLVFAVEILCAATMISHAEQPLAPNDVYDSVERAMLIDQGKEITSQRMTIVDPYDTSTQGVYVAAGYGEDRKPTSFGQGIQSATRLVQLNQAAEDEQYLYLFDRCLELGNDTLIIPLDVGAQSGTRGLQQLQAAAQQVGYYLVAENNHYQLYHIDTPAAFGLVSKYRAIAIGTGSDSIALGFPAVEETTNIWLDEYSFEDLSQYDVIYLAGFTYHDLATAEDLVLRLSENGTRILILADGIPSDEHSGTKSFLGVSCNTVNFQNGYPALDTIDGVLYCDLFASGYSKDWKTVYLNGLTDVWGTITDVPEGRMDFYGTGKNENIIYIGLALTYHYSLTLDPSVGMLLSHALDLSSTELPRREIVPITLDYRDNVITIDAPRDNVSTTLAYHDIFRPDREIRQANDLTVVDEGQTVIRLVYPYLVPGLCLTGVGLVAAVVYLILMKKRLKGLPADEAGQESGAAPVEDEAEAGPEPAPIQQEEKAPIL